MRRREGEKERRREGEKERRREGEKERRREGIYIIRTEPSEVMMPYEGSFTMIER
jgi:hypothetical protein